MFYPALNRFSTSAFTMLMPGLTASRIPKMRKIPTASLKSISQPSGPHPITRIRPHRVAAPYHVPRSLFAELSTRQPLKQRSLPALVSKAHQKSILDLELRAWTTPVHNASSKDETELATVEDVEMRIEEITLDEITAGIEGICLDEVNHLTTQIATLSLGEEQSFKQMDIDEEQLLDPMDIDPLPLVDSTCAPTTPHVLPLVFCSEPQLLPAPEPCEDIDMIDVCDEMDVDTIDDTDTHLPSMMDIDEYPTGSSELIGDLAMDVDERPPAPALQYGDVAMEYLHLMDAAADSQIREPAPAPFAIQEVDPLPLEPITSGETHLLDYEDQDAPPIALRLQFDDDAIEELMIRADLLITDVALDIEFNENNNELIFGTDSDDDEYEDEDDGLLAQDAESDSDSLFGPLSPS